MHSSDALLHDSLHAAEDLRVLLDDGVGQVAPVVQDHVRLPWLPVALRGSGDAAVDAPPEVVLLLALPREYRVPCIVC